MKNAMQLKAIVKNISKEKKISAQLVLQNYMLERFLERVSLSAYKGHFVIKGGFLIASMIGLDSRATMDMDITIKSLPVSEESVKEMIEEIIKIPMDDNIEFSIKRIGEIREGDEYTGYRVALTANYPPMAVPPGEMDLDDRQGGSVLPCRWFTRTVIYTGRTGGLYGRGRR